MRRPGSRRSAKKRMLIIDGTRLRHADLARSGQIESGRVRLFPVALAHEWRTRGARSASESATDFGLAG